MATAHATAPMVMMRMRLCLIARNAAKGDASACTKDRIIVSVPSAAGVTPNALPTCSHKIGNLILAGRYMHVTLSTILHRFN